MSSVAVRTLIRTFLANNSQEDVIDLTGQFGDLRQVVKDSDLEPDAPWLGLDFIGDTEEPVSLAATNTKGLYREYGQIQLHVVEAAKIGVGPSLESRAEVLRSLFRGLRIGGIIVENVSLLNTGPGATLEFEAGYVSGTITVIYHYDFTPGT